MIPAKVPVVEDEAITAIDSIDSLMEMGYSVVGVVSNDGGSFRVACIRP